MTGGQISKNGFLVKEEVRATLRLISEDALGDIGARLEASARNFL
jgi:hypothetical protein